ncbi:MAG: alpha/beta hydrolase [Acidimicrobiales bacterium]|nr:alpha/beta hydrolase [Acidimicrobiales bacterium]
MPQVHANGIDLEYDERGDPSEPAILLIMGLSAQMTAWDDRFVGELAGRGFRVIRFDNRDIGLSTWFDEAGVPDPVEVLATGRMPEPAYTISDMADDAAALLDALGVDRAHIVGASMGGMIAQTFAIAYPDRTLTLTSIMSTTGNPAVGQPKEGVPEELFLSPAPANADEAADAGVRTWKLIGSSGFEFDEDRIRGLARASYERALHPEGVIRQGLAVLLQPDRTEALAQLTVPTLVIHGEVDGLVDVSGGRATAEAIPGSELWTIPGMGHDLPPVLFAEVADRIAALAGRAGPG